MSQLKVIKNATGDGIAVYILDTGHLPQYLIHNTVALAPKMNTYIQLMSQWGGMFLAKRNQLTEFDLANLAAMCASAVEKMYATAEKRSWVVPVANLEEATALTNSTVDQLKAQMEATMRQRGANTPPNGEELN